MKAKNFNTEQQDKVKEVYEWVDLFNLTKDLTKREIHCATLGYYQGTVKEKNDFDGYGIATFKPVPLLSNQDTVSIQVAFFNDGNFEKDKIYLIIFTDYSFKGSVNTNTPRVINKTEDVHSINFGVVVDIK